MDSPEQSVNFLPSFSALTLVINESACASPGAECPLPVPGLWSDARANAASTNMSNETVTADSWGENQATILNIAGDGRLNTLGISLASDNDSLSPAVINDAAVVVSTNYTSRFPGGASYRLDTGFVWWTHVPQITCSLANYSASFPSLQVLKPRYGTTKRALATDITGRYLRPITKARYPQYLSESMSGRSILPWKGVWSLEGTISLAACRNLLCPTACPSDW